MAAELSKRLNDIINALPLAPGIRILEIGCGTGVAAREICRRIENVYILGVDRSQKAITKAIASSSKEISGGKIEFQIAAIEAFSFQGDDLFDLAFAIRVGALDGRHPQLEKSALANIAKALKPKGKFFIDGGNPLREIKIGMFRQMP